MFGKSENPDDYQRTARPIVALAIDHARDHFRPAHRHRRAQLVYAHRGVITVGTAQGRWVVPPSRAVWMPAGVEHWTSMPGQVQMRMLYFEPESVRALPGTCRVVDVTPLLRELILEAVRIPNHYPPESRAARLMRLIVDEIRTMDVLPCELPMPRDAKAVEVARRLLAALDCRWSLARWAREVGAAERTLARGFQRDTALSFGRWRQQARLQASLEQLAAGRSVLETALAVGYDSPSAFAAAFRRVFGVTPTGYFPTAAENGG